MKNSKSLKRTKEAHTAPTKYGMGDYYGTGIKQKVGIMKRDYLSATPSKSKNFGKPPKSLA